MIWLLVHIWNISERHFYLFNWSLNSKWIHRFGCGSSGNIGCYSYPGVYLTNHICQKFTCFCLTQYQLLVNTYVECTHIHYDDVIMGAIASQINCLTIVYSTINSDAHQRKYQSSASLTYMRGIHRGPVNSPHITPVTRIIFPFDDVIMFIDDSLTTAGLPKAIWMVWLQSPNNHNIENTE